MRISAQFLGFEFGILGLGFVVEVFGEIYGGGGETLSATVWRVSVGRNVGDL